MKTLKERAKEYSDKMTLSDSIIEKLDYEELVEIGVNETYCYIAGYEDCAKEKDAEIEQLKQKILSAIKMINHHILARGDNNMGSIRAALDILKSEK